MGGAWRRENKGGSNEKEREMGEEKKKVEGMRRREEGKGWGAMKRENEGGSNEKEWENGEGKKESRRKGTEKGR